MVRKDVIDAFVLGTRRWATASNEYVAACTALATALRDLAVEVDADPVLAGGMSRSAAEMRAYATALEEMTKENRDVLLAITDLIRLIDGLEDYKNDA